MSVIARTSDVKDTLDLFRAAGLYLKPIARLNVSVQLPQLKKSGAKISNWEVMEKVGYVHSVWCRCTRDV